MGLIIAGYGAYESLGRYSHKKAETRDYSYGMPGSSITYKQLKSEKRSRENFIKGLEGENFVLKQLNTLPVDYYVFHDVTLPDGRGNIDHIVVGPTGLFVIETKNYSGKYKINGNQWYYYKDNKYIKINKNPGAQLIRNTLDLKSFLETKGINKSEIYANGIVAFIQNKYTITQEPENYTVLSPKMIPKHIINNKKNQNLETLTKIAEELEPCCTELTYVPK